ncbi:hypothetical protein CJF32_00000561 [Rutstroemia sp. NJR-2017a WRK4]|nr:hypothetical protein CJF32_00000561 [Rutstroemia sp. NJR-2017a WRK4]
MRFRYSAATEKVSSCDLRTSSNIKSVTLQHSYRSMLYSYTYGLGRRSPLNVCRMEPARRTLLGRRYGFTRSRLYRTACHTLGAELAEATKSMFRRYLISTTYYICLPDISRSVICTNELAGNRPFGNLDGSLEAGPLQELPFDIICRGSKWHSHESSPEQQIPEVTGALQLALHRAYLSKFNSKERF